MAKEERKQRQEITFQANTPEQVTLKFDGPKSGEGKFGPWYLYSTTDDRVFFATEALYETINESGAKADDTVWITRKETKIKGEKSPEVEWVVSFDGVGPAVVPQTRAPRRDEGPAPFIDRTEEGDLTDLLGKSLALVEQRKRATPAVAEGNASPVTHTVMSQSLTACLLAAADASITTADYVAKKGLQLDVTFEDIRALASTLFIGLGKSSVGLASITPTPQQKQLVNGAAQWPPVH
jgi:hypothetical protein